MKVKRKCPNRGLFLLGIYWGAPQMAGAISERRAIIATQREAVCSAKQAVVLCEGVKVILCESGELNLTHRSLEALAFTESKGGTESAYTTQKSIRWHPESERRKDCPN